ncbi:DedA family protein [Pyxidicoccus fallax]|uniref:VTT domain-containing protein n=1 Tax=Pyxidicoccus fallax TaxID=394095 RepID=A0A848L8Z9_9BACT|nr:VTT domain-containing protein [Pyxidicoccus fallax]NMO15064.1 VTT domain-containing protein [Pyxidicoccus fallax]NPC78248.1 DedA family protein [Pyxidicoccus fallax]
MFEIPRHLTRAPLSRTRVVVGWAAFCALLLAGVLVPFALFGERLEALAQGFLSARPPAWHVALLLGGLLAGDVVLPVPSSFVGTAAGGLLGFWGGLVTAWLGMMGGCAVGYVLGARAGTAALRRMTGDAEVARLARSSERLGPWFLLVFRAVPVLAEASVVFAGTSRMPPRAFFTVCALANLGVSATYAALGATAAEWESFVVLFAGMVLVPGLALAWVRRGSSRAEKL